MNLGDKCRSSDTGTVEYGAAGNTRELKNIQLSSKYQVLYPDFNVHLCSFRLTHVLLSSVF